MRVPDCTIFLICIFAVAATACGSSPTVDLFEVREVYPKIIEPGDILTIEGEGFIEGKAQVELRGTVKPIGLRPARPLQFRMSGSAVSETKIEIPITAYQMDALTREAVRFEGIVNVSFPSKLKESALTLEAKSALLHLEFRPTGGGVKIHALKIREAGQLMQQLGIVVQSNSDDDVITVQRVLPDSFASTHNISTGSKLISVDGFPLFGVEELAGLDLSVPHIFEFVFPEGGARQIPVDLAVGNFKNDEFAAIVLTSIALGLFLAFVLPSYIRRTAIPKRTLQNPISYIFGYAIAAILTVLLPAIVMQWHLNVSGTVFVVSIYLICAATLLFYSKQPWLTRLFGTMGSIAAIASIVLMGGAAGNTLGLIDIVAAQAQTHFGLNVWRNPLIMLATILSISLLWPKPMLQQSNSLTNIAAWLMSICGAMAVVFFCLGGWIIPGLFEYPALNGPLLIVGAVFIFVIKTWLVLLAARTVVGASQSDRRKQGISAGVIQLRWIPMLALAGGAIYLELSPLPNDLQFAGQVISAGVFFTLFSLLLFTQLSIFHRHQQHASVQ
ncbi:MAG: hypothetical protein JXX29_23310 [Deltaproteobacteria bacterium]|nr:hypothetical protein [Deltaproteobacteria bacterium]MBN2674630.1 hypothetical protein [Deltaproteobacteria bacterium]